MGHNSDKLYVTHSEHAAGSHTASSFGKRQETGKSEFQRLPLYVFIFSLYSRTIPRKLIARVVCVWGGWYSDCCALSLQPFKNPVAVISEPKAGEAPRADVFDLLNIVPYIRKFKSSEFAPLRKRNSVSSDYFKLMRTTYFPEKDPVTGKPLETSQLIKLNFFRVRQTAYLCEKKKGKKADIKV